MKTVSPPLSDAELDGILGRLVAPAPSDALKRRVAFLTPLSVDTRPARPPLRRRFAVAAVLTLAIGGALVLYRAGSHETASAGLQRGFSAPDTTGDIPAQYIAIVDGPARTPPADTLSIAGLPLE